MKQYKPISSIFDPSSEVICPQIFFNFPPTLANKGFKLCFSQAFIFTLSQSYVPCNGMTGQVIRAGHFDLPLL